MDWIKSKGRTGDDYASNERRGGANEGICNVTPEGAEIAFGLGRVISPFSMLLADLGFCSTSEVSVLVGVTASIGIGIRLSDADMEGGFRGRVCGPVVWDDGDFGVNVWCGGWVSGRGCSVKEVLVRVWLC